MSIDMSSMIPIIHSIDIKINKDDESKRVRPVEESSESDSTDLQLNKEGFTTIIVRDNFAGVGDTYSTKGGLVKEAKIDRNGNHSSQTIDMII
jgi:hypothetical protein